MALRLTSFASVLVCMAMPLAARADAGSPEPHTALVEFDACLPLADGRVLAGSAGGLVVVDSKGRQQGVYTRLDGLPGTHVYALAEGDDGVWVGTEAGAARVSLADHRLRIEESYASREVRGLWVDDQGLYLATWGQGLLHLQGQALVSVGDVSAAPANRVTSVAKHKGKLWWTTAGAGLWQQSAGGEVSQDARFGERSILWSLAPGKDTLWVAGEEGLGEVGLGPQASALHALRGSAEIDGKRVVAGFGSGAQVWRGQAGDLPDDIFLRSVHSAHGISCMGSQDALWILRAGRWSKAQLDSRAHANDMAAFVSDGKQSFAGSFDQGVAELRDGRFVSLGIEIDPHINALAIDAQDGSLWIGTSTGLVQYRDEVRMRLTKLSGLPSRHIMSLFALPDGGVLVGTAAGAAIVRGKEVEVIGGNRPLITGNVWAVAHSDDGSHWIGSTQGVFRVRKGRVTRYRVASGELSDDWVMALALAEDGIFVGTYKGGVVRLRTTGNQVSSVPLGEGWINPGGLHWDGTHLRAATMQGALLGDGVHPTWLPGASGPGVDTTAYVPAGGTGSWVVTRRGLVRYPRTF